MKIGTGSILLLAFLLVGCGPDEPEWVRDQYERCFKMGGTGTYNRVTFLFECWKRTEPPSRSRKLYELKYR